MMTAQVQSERKGVIEGIAHVSDWQRGLYWQGEHWGTLGLSWIVVTLERNVRRPLARLGQSWAALQHFWEPSFTVVRATCLSGEKTQSISVCGALTPRPGVSGL